MAITTQSSRVTAGSLCDRAAAFDMPAKELDGTDVELVWKEADKAIERARAGKGPSFLLAKCSRPQGHMLGDPLKRILKEPVKELSQMTVPLLKSITKSSGASFRERLGSLKEVGSLLGHTVKERYAGDKDPLQVTRKRLTDHLPEIEAHEKEASKEMEGVVNEVLDIIQQNIQS